MTLSRPSDNIFLVIKLIFVIQACFFKSAVKFIPVEPEGHFVDVYPDAGLFGIQHAASSSQLKNRVIAFFFFYRPAAGE